MPNRIRYVFCDTMSACRVCGPQREMNGAPVQASSKRCCSLPSPRSRYTPSCMPATKFNIKQCNTHARTNARTNARTHARTHAQTRTCALARTHARTHVHSGATWVGCYLAVRMCTSYHCRAAKTAGWPQTLLDITVIKTSYHNIWSAIRHVSY